MPLNKTTGNMYDFITHTWNPIKGRCSHGCSYCYMKAMARRFPSLDVPIHLDEKELRANLGEGNFIFVGSSCDMWADDVSDKDITLVLRHCQKFDNTYLFQSKNPSNFLWFKDDFPKETIFCTTIETNRLSGNMGKTPSVSERGSQMTKISHFSYKTMVTVEPIMEFDTRWFVELLRGTGAFQVNIGADSGNNHLPEPPREKILELISELEKFTKVVQKKNLGRIFK